MVKTRKDTDTNNYHRKFNRESYFRGSSARGRNSCYSRTECPRNKRRYFYNKRWEKIPSSPYSTSAPRPLSPVEGSEEFTARKIQQTSAIIMRQLLSPNDPIASSSNLLKKDNKKTEQTLHTSIKPIEKKDKQSEKGLSKARKSSTSEINVKEIHEKIMNRITNLNDGRKKNFINTHNYTSLDDAIQHIHKQKRLELSRILRDMCSSTHNPQKSGELINSIIPDIGIKIEELPIDVIQELRQTLNLDLDEDLLEFDSPAIQSPDTISSNELNAAVDSIQVKSEQIDTSICSVEIKPEDISDYDDFADNTRDNAKEDSFVQREEATIQATENNEKEINNQLTYSVTIKEEPKDDCDSILTNCSESTVYFPNNIRQHEEPETGNKNQTNIENIFGRDREDIENIPGQNQNEKQIDSRNKQNDDNGTNSEHCEDASSQTDYSLSSLDNFVSQFFEREDDFDMNDLNKISDRVDSIDKCLKYLIEYKQRLVKSVLKHCCRIQGLNKNREGIGISQNQVLDDGAQVFSNWSDPTVENVTVEEEDPVITKKRKVVSNTQYSEQNEETNIKTEQADDELTVEDILTFPKLKDKVTVIQRVDNQLILATEIGNIIYASLTDGSFIHTLDVTASPITSVAFVRGINQFISMFVGSLDQALRVYNFKSKTIIKAIPLNDHITCMDTMWDYVFIGCKGGTLIRYSIKKWKIEFEEKNAVGADILVLKAVQEGPRKVLLVGHKRAPIYVRDAISGLYLRNFSNEAITPTVYALIVNNNFLYCGTAHSNILVFSIHEGNLLNRLFAEDCKGISCMKIYKNLLFSGCYNGSIYVYHLKVKRLLTILKGPGGSISCMEVLNNQVIVGTLSGHFGSVVIPAEVQIDS